jgi:uncharacterized protein (DUF488 family)
MPWLATIGYEGAPLDAFLATLKQLDVRTLIDVRQVPVSRRKGYSMNQLRDAVEAQGIRYVHLVGLGDPKEGRDAARQGRFAEFRRIFARHLKTAQAQADLETAARIAEKGSACLLCYEQKPEFCHRSIVADALAQKTGVEIRHHGVRGEMATNDSGQRPRAGVGARQGVATCR